MIFLPPPPATPPQLGPVYGGACFLDLESGVVTPIIDPRYEARSFSVATANPHVADMWLLLPETERS